jgi:competence protein ComEC
VVYVSPMMFEKASGAVEALRDSLDRARVPVREVFAGDLLSGGEGCRIEVLHPPRRGVLGSDNANSVVLAIQCQGRRILLPGDLESPGLNDLVAEEPWPCDVLLAPHHGSRGSDPPQLANWSTPKYLVVSGGLSGDIRSTLSTYRRVGADVLHTGQCGAIEVRLDQRGVKISNTSSTTRGVL